MLALPSMIAEAARKAGMAVPEDPDGEWEASDFPHFNAFCVVQLGRPISSWGQSWGNAKVVAGIPLDELRTMTVLDVIKKGIQV